jgi:hypothetical protein
MADTRPDAVELDTDLHRRNSADADDIKAFALEPREDAQLNNDPISPGRKRVLLLASACILGAQVAGVGEI